MPLWLALAGPPVLWMGHLLVSYGLVYVTCRSGGRVWFLLATLVAAVGIGAVMVSTGPVRRVDPPQMLVSEGDEPTGRATMSRVAWMLAAFFLLVALMTGVAAMLVSPCL